MAMVALIARVSVNLMEEHNIEPRCLADDLMFTAEGSAHRSRAINGMLLCRQFFTDMGAKVATNKCFMFSTCSHARAFLKHFQWCGAGFSIPVLNTFRDIGSHLNVTNSSNGRTRTQRMQKATRVVKRLAYLPLATKDKEMIIRCSILPAALSGSEATHVSPVALTAFRSAVASVIGSGSARRSIDATFAYASSSKDLDPQTHLLFNIIASLRRLAAKQPHSKQIMEQLLRIYRLHGTGHGVHGPVANCVQHLHNVHAHINHDFTICQDHEMAINMMTMPWQHLKKAVFDMASRARAQRLDLHRTYHSNVGEIDSDVIHIIVSSIGTNEAKVLKHIATAGFWNEALKVSIQLADGACPHCGQLSIPADHIHWRCPVIHEHRTIQALSRLDPDVLPTCVKVGLPPSVTHDFTKPYLG